MSHLKLRLRFNPGREGTPLDKLGDFATQMEKFLRAFAADLGVTVQKGEWLAKEFRNESTSWDTLYVEPVDDEVTRAGMKALDALTGPDPYSACNAGDVQLFDAVGVLEDRQGHGPGRGLLHRRLRKRHGPRATLARSLLPQGRRDPEVS